MMDDNHLSLDMSKVKVSTCTWKTTSPSSLFVTADIKNKSSADHHNEQFLSNTNNRNDGNSTVITEQSHLHVISRKVHVFSRKVLHYRRKENLSSSDLCQSESASIDVHVRGKSQTQLCLPEVLKITMYTQNTDAECANKHQFMNVQGTVYILDHIIDTTDKKIYTRSMQECNKSPPLNMNNKAEECDKIKPVPDGQLYFTENTDLNMEESIVANGKLPSEIQLLHDTNRTLNEEINKCDNEGNQMDDINQSLNLSSVQNQIKIENIDEISDVLNGQTQFETDEINQTPYLSNASNMKMENIHQTSDILHAQKEMETDDINRTPNLSNRSTIKMENIDQTSDLLQGHKQTQIQVLTNRNFTDSNDTENQTHTTQIKKENVQDETPTLNRYQENICEFEQTTSTHNLHFDHSSVIDKDGINKSCFKEYQILTALVHDHKYCHVPEGDWKTDLPIKGNLKLLRRKNLLRGQINKLKEKWKAMEDNRKLKIEASESKLNEQNSILKEQIKEEMLKVMEENRKLRKEAHRSELNERNRILKEQIKKEKMKAMEEKRKLKKEVSLQPVPCPICEEIILPKNMWKHKWVCSEEPFLCVFCGILLKNRREVYHHEKYNHNGSPKNCDICHKTFKSTFALIMHKRRYHHDHIKKGKKTESERNFLCSICGKTFSSGKFLESHIPIHSDERPFKCSYCDADFKTKNYLLKHIRLCHDSGKIFLCTESGCDKQYNRKDSWQRHMKWHQDCKTAKDERPFKCSYCDAVLKFKSSLKKHILFFHNSGKMYSCTESGCERKYISNDSLQRHVKWHQKCKTDEGPLQVGFRHNSGKIFSCTESGCERKYKYKDSLQRHLKWHQKCKTATGPIHTTRMWSGEENNILRAVFKEEISGNKIFDREKMRRFIKKYPWVLKDVQTQNDLRLKRIRTKLYMERFINKHSANNHGNTNTPSKLSVNNSAETEAHLTSEPSDSYSGETEPSVNNSAETEAHLTSEPSDSYSGETESSVN